MRLIRSAALMLVLVLPVEAQVHQAPPNAPARAVITPESEPGTRITVSGRVLGKDDRPLSGASIYVYQTDARGEYIPGGTGASGSDRPRLFGYLRSDARGEYSFSTIRPGSYPNSRNPGHIHFEVVADGHQARIYEIVFEGDPLIPEAFRDQAKSPYGGVAIVTIRAGRSGVQDVAHDVKVRPSS